MQPRCEHRRTTATRPQEDSKRQQLRNRSSQTRHVTTHRQRQRTTVQNRKIRARGRLSRRQSTIHILRQRQQMRRPKTRQRNKIRTNQKLQHPHRTKNIRPNLQRTRTHNPTHSHSLPIQKHRFNIHHRQQSTTTKRTLLHLLNQPTQQLLRPRQQQQPRSSHLQNQSST